MANRPPCGAAVGVGAAALAVLCCAAGPVLIAGGALGVAGGLLRSPLVFGLAALVLIAAVLVALRHPRSGAICDAPSPVAHHSARPTEAHADNVNRDPSTSFPEG
jgi:hypothetical protein